MSFSSYCFLQYCDVDFLSIKKISNVKLHDGCKQKISKSFCFSTHTWIIIMDKSNGISGIRYQEKAWKAIHYKKKKKKWAALMLIHLIEPKWCPNSRVWSMSRYSEKIWPVFWTHSCQHWLLTKWLLFKPNYNWLP